MIYACTRQIVDTSMKITSTSDMEITRSGVNVLYPPIDQLAVAAAAASSSAAFSAASLSASEDMVMKKATQT